MAAEKIGFAWAAIWEEDVWADDVWSATVGGIWGAVTPNTTSFSTVTPNTTSFTEVTPKTTTWTGQ